MEYIELKDALHIVDVISSDEGIKRKCKAIRKRLKELPTVNVGEGKPKEEFPFFVCPECGGVVTPHRKFCCDCGLKLDWSDEE